MARVHPQQKAMPYDFTDFNGNQWPKPWVETYNRLTDKINQSGSGVPGSLAEQEREALLNARHKHFVCCQELSERDRMRALDAQAQFVTADTDLSVMD